MLYGEQPLRGFKAGRPNNIKTRMWTISLSTFFVIGLVSQGCVIHKHPQPYPPDNTYSRNKHWHKHKTNEPSYRKQGPKVVNTLPADPHPSETQGPPAHARAYEVAQGKPFTEDGQHIPPGHIKKESKGKPFMNEGQLVPPGQAKKEYQAKQTPPDQAKKEQKTEKIPPGLAKKDNQEKPVPPGQEKKASEGKLDNKGDHPSAKARGNKPENSGKSKGPQVAKADIGPSPSKGKAGQKGPGKFGDREKGASFSKDKGTKGFKNKNNDEEPLWNPETPTKLSQKTGKGNNKAIWEEELEADQQWTGKKFKETDPANDPPSVQNQPEGDGNDQTFVIGKNNRKKPGRNKNKIQVFYEDAPSSPQKTPKQNTGNESDPSLQNPPPPMEEPKTVTASMTPLKFDSSQRNIIISYFQNSQSQSKGKRGKGKGGRMNKILTVRLLINDTLSGPTEPLPQDLEGQLPSLPQNTRRVLYGQQVVLVEAGSNRVLDVIHLNN